MGNGRKNGLEAVFAIVGTGSGAGQAAGGELVMAPPLGTPLKCELALGMHPASVHSGVFLGGGCVAELNGDGSFRIVSLSQFLNGADGEWNLRSGPQIYAACDKTTGTPLGSPGTAARARAIAEKGKRVEYNLRFRNCHWFTAGCVSGMFSDEDGKPWMVNRLEATISRVLNRGRPVEWRPVSSLTSGAHYVPTVWKRIRQSVSEWLGGH